MVVNNQGRLFFAENGSSVVELDAVQKPTIRSTADLLSVGPNGWLERPPVSRDSRVLVLLEIVQHADRS